MGAVTVGPVAAGEEFPAVAPELEAAPVEKDGSMYLVFEGENEQTDGVRAVGSERAANPEAAIEQYAQKNQVDEGVFLRAMALRNWPKAARRVGYERRVVLG